MSVRFPVEALWSEDFLSMGCEWLRRESPDEPGRRRCRLLLDGSTTDFV
jgi:hypothetical protein